MKKVLNKFRYNMNKKKYGQVGKNSSLPKKLSGLATPYNIFIGNYVSIGEETFLYATKESKIIIKDGVIIAPRCKIITSNHNFDSTDLKAIPFDNRNFVKDIVINEASWIGESVIILSGITIGKGVVVGAGSVVTKDIPDYAIAVGNPAKIIKYRNKEKFEELLNEKKYYKNSNFKGKEFVKG